MASRSSSDLKDMPFPRLAKPCDVLPLADDVRVLVIDAGFSTLPPNEAVEQVPEVEWDTRREMVDETDATVILVCGAAPIHKENGTMIGNDVIFPFCWYKIPSPYKWQPASGDLGPPCNAHGGTGGGRGRLPFRTQNL